jgi:hypothetical protein
MMFSRFAIATGLFVLLSTQSLASDRLAGKTAVACTSPQDTEDVMNIMGIEHTKADLAPYLDASVGRCIMFEPDTKVTVVDDVGGFAQVFYRAADGKLVKLWIADGELIIPGSEPAAPKIMYMNKQGFACEDVVFEDAQSYDDLNPDASHSEATKYAATRVYPVAYQGIMGCVLLPWGTEVIFAPHDKGEADLTKNKTAWVRLKTFTYQDGTPYITFSDFLTDVRP